MPNPYGIEQVDVPGILSAYTAARAARTQQVMAQRQMDREDRADERDIARTSALAKVYAARQQKGGDPASNGASPASLAAPPTSGQPQSNPAYDQALNDYSILAPQEALAIQQHFAQMDEGQAKLAHQNLQQVGGLLAAVRALPEAQRAAAVESIKPQAAALGYGPEHFANFKTDNQSIDFEINKTRDVENILKDRQSRFMAPQPGAPLVDTNDPAAIANYNASVGMGSAAPQGDSLPHPKTQQEYDALPPGPYIGKNGEHLIKGGASPSGSQTFSGPNGF